MSRAVVVVDVETSALRPTRINRSGTADGPWGVVVEVAWWNLTTGEHATFVPPHRVGDVVRAGDPKALEVNRYFERLAHAKQDDGQAWWRLHEQLTDNTLAGSNPAFEALWLAHTYRDGKLPEPWHHRLLDVSAYAGGAVGQRGAGLLGLADLCDVLEVDPPDHTAAGDVRAAGECLYMLGAVERPGGEL